MIAPLAVLCRLRDDRRGVAFLEFAFTLPIALMIILYGVEIANYGLSILRVHQIAATSADNAARVRESISETDVNEVLLGGKIVGEAIEFANRGRIVLSSVTPNGLTGSAAGQMIVWQRCTGALNVVESRPQYGEQGKGTTDGSLQSMGATGRQIAASPGSAMIFVEATYRYNPIFSSIVLGTPIIRSEASFTVRERQSETLTSASGSTASTCTRYDL